MRDHREASTVLRRCARVHHSLGAQAALHPEVLGLAPDQSDHIAAQKHLHLSVAILEELVLGHLALVSKQVHEDVCDLLEEFQVVQMNDVSVNAL